MTGQLESGRTAARRTPETGRTSDGIGSTKGVACDGQRRFT